MNGQFYSNSGGWSQTPENGFGGSSNFGRSTFGSSFGGQNGYTQNGYKENGFSGNGFNGAPTYGGYGQTYSPECNVPPTANGYSHMNGYSQPRPQNGFGGASKSDSSPRNGGDWTKQANGCESQEKDLFDTANSGINFDKYDDIPVNISGGEPLPPIDTFAAANLHDFVQENVNKTGYVKPTPVQKYSIPTLLANRDLMSCAQTGSGKTAAFLLPIIHHILTDGPDAVKAPVMSSTGRRCFFPSALILSPTRELAIQIHKEASKFSYRTNLITAILYGGRENYRDQINRLRGGCNILIATPGRLIDIIEQGYIGLAGCRYLVLDEADRMLDMGFEPQIRKIVQSGAMPDKQARITAMFSATFPKAIQELAGDFLKQDYLFLTVGRVGSTSENIDQEVMLVEEYDKKKVLLEVLEKEEENSLVLIFVETKRGANELTYFLQRQQIRAVAIHGDLKQYERERNLSVFRTGQYPVLVATAVAARGLDIPNVKHVINHDLPSDIDEYVHRIGRTGRCGNIGRSTSFWNDKNRGIAKDLMNLMTEANKEIPDWLQRAAAEGRISSGRTGRGGGGRFGGTDFRRNTRGGYSSSQTSFGGQSNGYGGGAYGSGFGSATGGFSGSSRGGYAARPSGFDNGYGGGFGGANGGFNGNRMMPYNGMQQGYSQPNYGGSMGGYPPQQRGYDGW